MSKAGLTQGELFVLDETLWELTRQICDRLDESDQRLPSDFNQQLFDSRVLKWCKLNSAANDLWTKPFGHSGDYRIIELIC